MNKHLNYTFSIAGKWINSSIQHKFHGGKYLNQRKKAKNLIFLHKFSRFPVYPPIIKVPDKTNEIRADDLRRWGDPRKKAAVAARARARWQLGLRDWRRDHRGRWGGRACDDQGQSPEYSTSGTPTQETPPCSDQPPFRPWSLPLTAVTWSPAREKTGESFERKQTGAYLCNTTRRPGSVHPALGWFILCFGFLFW